MDDEKLMEIWGSVGFVMHLAQLIEYNIVNIIAGNKFLKDITNKKNITIDEYEKRAYRSNKILHNLSYNKTMGDVVYAAKDAKLFDDEIAQRIDLIKSKRDYYAHTFFKEQLFSKDMENNPDQLLEQLKIYIEEMNNMNTILIEIDKKQREEAKRIKDSICS